MWVGCFRRARPTNTSLISKLPPYLLVFHHLMKSRLIHDVLHVLAGVNHQQAFTFHFNIDKIWYSFTVYFGDIINFSDAFSPSEIFHFLSFLPGWKSCNYLKHYNWPDFLLRYLTWMSEAGLTSFWRRVVITEFQKSEGQGTGQMESAKWRPQSLTLEHLQGAFIALLLGTGLALIVLIFEVLCY